MWAGVRSIDAGSAVPPPVWQLAHTLNALDLSCVRVGAAGGGVDEALICPRIAPLGAAGVFTFTYSLLAVKLPTSLAVMVASSVDQWPMLTLSLVRARSFGPLAPAAAVSTSAAVASSTPVELTCTVSVLAAESTVVAATPAAVPATGGASWEPARPEKTTVTLSGVIWPRISPAGLAAEAAITYSLPCRSAVI